MSVKNEITDKVVFRILNDISLKTNTPIAVVKDIVYSQFKYLRILLSVGDRADEESFLNVSLVNIGKFSAKKDYIKYCKENGVLKKGLEKQAEYEKRRKRNQLRD
jgi:hypothetical protein